MLIFFDSLASEPDFRWSNVICADGFEREEARLAVLIRISLTVAEATVAGSDAMPTPVVLVVPLSATGCFVSVFRLISAAFVGIVMSPCPSDRDEAATLVLAEVPRNNGPLLAGARPRLRPDPVVTLVEALLSIPVTRRSCIVIRSSASCLTALKR